MSDNSQPILTLKHLKTAFDTESGRVRAVDDVSFSLFPGKILGLVGESGCGKSVTALSIMRLLPKPSGVIEAGQIRFFDTNLVDLPPETMSRYRGRRLAMIFQEPMTALNPVHRIGRQLGEVYRLHMPEMSATDIRAASAAMLHKAGIADPEQLLSAYPHQMSGGMRQRIMIAMALAARPEILIADEPTTALDVTIQAQILDLIQKLQEETGMAVIFITHDLGVIAEICSEVVVMYAGQVAEAAPVDALFADPKHPYTRGLLASIPRLETPSKSRLPIIPGTVPGLTELPPGCRFQNRCSHAMGICRTATPPTVMVGRRHSVSCYLYGQETENG